MAQKPPAQTHSNFLNADKVLDPAETKKFLEITLNEIIGAVRTKENQRSNLTPAEKASLATDVKNTFCSLDLDVIKDIAKNKGVRISNQSAIASMSNICRPDATPARLPTKDGASPD